MRKFSAALIALALSACGPSTQGATIAPDTPLIVGEDQPQVLYGQVVSEGIGFSAGTLPTLFEKIATTTNCRRTPRPSSNARAAYVYTYGGGKSVPAHHVNFEDTPELAAERRKMLQAMKRDPKTRPNTAVQKAAMRFAAGNAVEQAQRVDILVTETEAPVFLYLASYDSVLWNIQRAPGVEIDGIIVNSYNAGIVANGVDAGRTAFISFANSPGKDCYVKGQGRAVPAEERVAAAKARNPSIDLRNYEKQWRDEYRHNMKFFRSELPRLMGARPEWILNDAKGGSFDAVLVGPAPAAPFAEHPVTKLQIPSHTTPFWGTRQDAMKNFGLDVVS